MIIGLDTAEFNSYFHTYLDIVNITVNQLGHQFHTVGQLGNSNCIRSLIGELLRGHSDNGIG